MRPCDRNNIGQLWAAMGFFTAFDIGFQDTGTQVGLSYMRDKSHGQMTGGVDWQACSNNFVDQNPAVYQPTAEEEFLPFFSIGYLACASRYLDVLGFHNSATWLNGPSNTALTWQLGVGSGFLPSATERFHFGFFNGASVIGVGTTTNVNCWEDDGTTTHVMDQETPCSTSIEQANMYMYPAIGGHQ
jgi:hypothetical protein